MNRRNLLTQLLPSLATIPFIGSKLHAQVITSPTNTNGQFWADGTIPFTIQNGGIHVHTMQQTNWSLGTTTVNMDGEAQLNASAGVLVCTVCGILKVDMSKVQAVLPGSNSPVIVPQDGNEGAP